MTGLRTATLVEHGLAVDAGRAEPGAPAVMRAMAPGMVPPTRGRRSIATAMAAVVMSSELRSRESTVIPAIPRPEAPRAVRERVLA